MPAKKQVTREALLDAAVEIIRKDGIDALNMRTLAQKCNCSTQPIYLSFSGAEELKNEVVKKINCVFETFINEEIASKKYPEYKAIGMGYVRFAKEEKELFKYLMMRNRCKDSDWEAESFDKPTYLIMQNYGLYKDNAQKLHAEMWIFVHGIASMFATGYLDWNWDTVSEMITDVFNGLTANKDRENNNDITD